MKYIKKFETQAAYEAAESSLILPNVSLTVDNNTVHYKPYVEPIETRVVAKFNVTDTSSPTPIGYDNGYDKYTSGFSAIEIDGVEQPSVVSAYTFSTTGEHTVKYTLTDPTKIGTYAFLSCRSITSVNIPNSVTTIGTMAFSQCVSMTNCPIGSGVTSIGISAFTYCSGITSVNIPNSVTSIGNSAFQYCSGLTSCTIGSGVTSIGDSAFRNCRGLTIINIPSGVTSIGDYAFTQCTSLTSITSNAATAPMIDRYTFMNVKTGGTLTVPIGSSGYDVWMRTSGSDLSGYYLGFYNWTKVEQ